MACGKISSALPPTEKSLLRHGRNFSYVVSDFRGLNILFLLHFLTQLYDKV